MKPTSIAMTVFLGVGLLVLLSSSSSILGARIAKAPAMSAVVSPKFVPVRHRVAPLFRSEIGSNFCEKRQAGNRHMIQPSAFSSSSRPVIFSAQTETRLPLTPENVELVLDEVRPYLQADGGSVDFVEIDGPLVKLRLKGACSSCASSATTMQLGIKRRLQERIEGVQEVVEIGATEEKMAVTVENIEMILDEIRPYLVGASGGSLDYLGGIEQNDVKIRITGPAAKIMTVRVAIQQKIKEKFPNMMRVELVT